MASVAVYRVRSYEGSEIIYDALKSEYDVELVGRSDVEEGLSRFDVAVFPGGYEHVFTAFFSRRFREGIREFVEFGGGYVGICGGAFLACYLGLGNCVAGYRGLVACSAYYSLVGWEKARRPVRLKWAEGNIFGRSGEQEMVWACSPYITDPGKLSVDAYYGENLLLSPLKDKGAVVSGRCGDGKVVLFGPHPELSHSTVRLLLEAVKWEEGMV